MNMKSIILAYLKLYKFSPQNIQSIIVDRNFLVLVEGLMKYDVQTRKRILNHLLGRSISHHQLNRALIGIVREDFLEHAAIALQILEANNVHKGKLSASFHRAKERYLDRKRRQENKKAFYKNYTPGVSSNLIDKSKMEQLERVRQQLKKSIRFH